MGSTFCSDWVQYHVYKKMLKKKLVTLKQRNGVWGDILKSIGGSVGAAERLHEQHSVVVLGGNEANYNKNYI